MATYVHDAADITAVQTDDNTPLVVTVSSFGVGYNPYKAFNHTDVVLADAWVASAGDTLPGWLTIDFGAGVAKYFTGCKLSACEGGNSGRLEGTMAFRASNNNSDWITLLQLTGESAFGSLEMRTYSWANTTGYRYFGFIKTAGVGNYDPYIGELEIFETIPSAIRNNIMIF